LAESSWGKIPMLSARLHQEWGSAPGPLVTAVDNLEALTLTLIWLGLEDDPHDGIAAKWITEMSNMKVGHNWKSSMMANSRLDYVDYDAFPDKLKPIHRTLVNLLAVGAGYHNRMTKIFQPLLAHRRNRQALQRSERADEAPAKRRKTTLGAGSDILIPPTSSSAQSQGAPTTGSSSGKRKAEFKYAAQTAAEESAELGEEVVQKILDQAAKASEDAFVAYLDVYLPLYSSAR